MIDLDKRIKVVLNRCENELKPKLKALSKSESSVCEELSKAKEQKAELLLYKDEIEKEIKKVQKTFED